MGWEIWSDLSWPSIAIGALASLPLSVIAGLIVIRLQRWQADRQPVIHQRQRALALAEYRTVKNWVENPLLLQVGLSELSLSMMNALVLSLACGLAALILGLSADGNNTMWLICTVLAVVGGGGFIATSLAGDRYQLRIGRLRRFERYQDQIRERFGDDALSE